MGPSKYRRIRRTYTSFRLVPWPLNVNSFIGYKTTKNCTLFQLPCTWVCAGVFSVRTNLTRHTFKGFSYLARMLLQRKSTIKCTTPPKIALKDATYNEYNHLIRPASVENIRIYMTDDTSRHTETKRCMNPDTTTCTGQNKVNSSSHSASHEIRCILSN